MSKPSSDHSAQTAMRIKAPAVQLIRSTPGITQKAKPIIWWQGIRFIGAGTFVAVGYIDPGNWATDLAGGSYAGYALLSIVLISSLLAMLLQIMSARLGIATGKDLAELTREVWPRFAWPAWIMAELTIIATDLAEVIGSAIALQLLFAIPIAVGIVLSIFDVLLILALDRRGSWIIGKIIASFLFIIACGFLYELLLARPVMGEVMSGYVPTLQFLQDPKLFYLAIGIIGATVMPHNLYLHSNLVLRKSDADKSKAASFARINTIISLSVAMLLNSGLVVLAASVFNHAGQIHVAEITEAHYLLTPLLGTGTAAIVFAIMLLASGQSATITGTLAGQVVMTGFVRLHMKPWVRRLVTRTLALIPSLVAIYYFGERCITSLLVNSQVFLSLQLPLAMISLLYLTSDKQRMGSLVNSTWISWLGWIGTVVIMITNAILIVGILRKGL